MHHLPNEIFNKFDRTGINVNRKTTFTKSYQRRKVAKRSDHPSRDETRHIEKIK